MSEHEDQVALFSWAALAANQRPELALLFAIPNGGHRHKAVAARMKAEGVKAGVPDICLPVARRGYHGMFIELKTRRGRLTMEQTKWLSALIDEGYWANTCRGFEEAKHAIEEYLGPPF